METFDLPEEVDLRQVTVSAKQFRFGVGMTRTRYAEQVRAGVVKFSSGGEGYTIPPEIELDRVTVTQKQFALAVGKSPARINQLVKQGVLVNAPASRRLMFLASMENYYSQGR